ncbi:MAG: hypothetical protein EBR82_09980 [Caulobacteraceae bacterium]|nr:hypothetical protein [Caulobacteraceae bacterium]
MNIYLDKFMSPQAIDAFNVHYNGLKLFVKPKNIKEHLALLLVAGELYYTKISDIQTENNMQGQAKMKLLIEATALMAYIHGSIATYAESKTNCGITPSYDSIDRELRELYNKLTVNKIS